MRETPIQAQVSEEDFTAFAGRARELGLSNAALLRLLIKKFLKDQAVL